jgi:hypothetical protein
MHWFWMNIPLAALIFAVWTGVPLWLVLKHPDTGPQRRVPKTPPTVQPAAPASPRPADAYRPRQAGRRQELAGAPR